MQKSIDMNLNEMLMVHDNFQKYKNVQSIQISGTKEKKKYKYSIVIPTYMRVETLKETIQSCLKLDDEDDYNVIVVDNNPARGDETEQYITNLNNPNIKYYKNAKNIGMTGNWNRCLELCEGEYAVLLHDDDIVASDFFTNVNNIINRHPEIDILYVGLKCWHQEHNSSVPEIGCNHKQYSLFKSSLINCLFTINHTPTGVVIKKESFISLGGFDERFYPSSDYYFYTYATINGKNVYNYLKPLVIYRLLINESMKEETKINFVIITNPLHRWLINKLNISKIISKWLLSVKVNSGLVLCKPETITNMSINGITYSKVLLTRNKCLRNVLIRYYNIQLSLIKKIIYRRVNAFDYM